MRSATLRTITAGVLAGLLAMGGGIALAGAQDEAPPTTVPVEVPDVPEVPEAPEVPEVPEDESAEDNADAAEDAAEAAQDAAEAAEEANDPGPPEGVTTGRPENPGRPDGVGPPDSVGNPIADAARRGPEFPAECGNFGRWVSATKRGVACTPPPDGVDD